MVFTSNVIVINKLLGTERYLLVAREEGERKEGEKEKNTTYKLKVEGQEERKGKGTWAI